jgi:hypothetical protein
MILNLGKGESVMFKILNKKVLHENILQFTLEAPLIARKAEPGQFVVLRVNEYGERVPLTIADFDREKGTIDIIFMVIGASTTVLASLNAGDSILDLVGPLGKKTDIRPDMGTVVCIGGGIGVAPIYPIARKMKQVGNHVITIMGAKNKDILILKDEMEKISDEVIVTTDDGSYGIKGFVTTALQQLIDKGIDIAEVVAIGPVIMMKTVADTTRPYNIKTIVSLNPIMVDGTGMCGGCRVQVGDETKFACVDGPEFDGHLVDFVNLMERQRMYRPKEEIEKDHICRLVKKVEEMEEK